MSAQSSQECNFPETAPQREGGPPLRRHSPPSGPVHRDRAEGGHSDQEQFSTGQATQHSFCSALTRGQQLNPWDPGVGAFAYSSSAEVSVAKSGSSRRGGLNTANGSCGSWGSCHQHSKAPNVGQHNQQKLAQSVLPTILRDSTPAGQHMEEASVLVPEELLYFL